MDILVIYIDTFAKAVRNCSLQFLSCLWNYGIPLAPTGMFMKKKEEAWKSLWKK